MIIENIELIDKMEIFVTGGAGFTGGHLAEVFVFALRYEGFSLVLSEAMTAGLPLVARRPPIYEDFFRENGCLIDDPVAPDLAASVIDLPEDEDTCAVIGNRNRNGNDAVKYDWEWMPDETTAVLESVAGTTEFAVENSELK